jgi:hypothetical protein
VVKLLRRSTCNRQVLYLLATLNHQSGIEVQARQTAAAFQPTLMSAINCILESDLLRKHGCLSLA